MLGQEGGGCGGRRSGREMKLQRVGVIVGALVLFACHDGTNAPAIPDEIALREVTSSFGDSTFTAIINAVPMRNGDLVISDPGEGKVVRLGKQPWVYQRKGKGPGEITRLGRVFPWRGDSVLIWDSSLRRLTALIGKSSGAHFNVLIMKSPSATTPMAADTFGRIYYEHVGLSEWGSAPGNDTTLVTVASNEKVD